MFFFVICTPMDNHTHATLDIYRKRHNIRNVLHVFAIEHLRNAQHGALMTDAVNIQIDLFFLKKKNLICCISCRWSYDFTFCRYRFKIVLPTYRCDWLACRWQVYFIWCTQEIIKMGIYFKSYDIIGVSCEFRTNMRRKKNYSVISPIATTVTLSKFRLNYNWFGCHKIWFCTKSVANETQTSHIQLFCNVGTLCLRLATVQRTFHWKKIISFVHTYVEMWNPVRLSLGNAVLCFIKFYQYDFHSGNPTHIHIIFTTRSIYMHFVYMECFFYCWLCTTEWLPVNLLQMPLTAYAISYCQSPINTIVFTLATLSKMILGFFLCVNRSKIIQSIVIVCSINQCSLEL